MVCGNIFTATPNPNVGDGAFSHKIDYDAISLDIINPEGHLNRLTAMQCKEQGRL